MAFPQPLTRQVPPRHNKKTKSLHPQSALSRFWYRYHSRKPGKITSIFPQELYKNISKGCGEPLADRRNASQSYEIARDECRASVRAVVEQCERTNTRFCDSDFDIDADFFSQELNYLRGLTTSDICDDSSDDDYDDFSMPRKGASSRQRRVKESLKMLRDSGLFADKQMTVNMHSLERYLSAERSSTSPSRSLPKSVHRLDWIFENPKFTVNGFSSFDIKQGGVGDCWWLAAVGNIAHRSDLMEKICVARDEECGVYGFVFHRDGEWISTVIDDNLYLTHEDFGHSSDVYDVSGKKARLHKKQKQTGSEALYFAKCEDENETWLPLLEKAYAKVHGDYVAIEGGWAGTAVEDLTGGVTTMILGNCVLRKDKLWREMLGVDEVKSEFVFALSASSESTAPRKNGLVLRHAYSILKATEVEDGSGRKHRLLKIKNPWGQRSDSGFGVWHGPWSDGSKEWTPELLGKLHHEFADDGVFWMAFEDVLSNFKWIHRTRLFDERWTVAQQWMSTSVSWVPGFLKTKFVVEVKKEGMVVIVLSNLDQRYFQGLEGMYSFSLEFQLKSIGSDSINFLTSPKISANFDLRSVNCEVYLHPGTYEVLPRVTATHCPWNQPVEQVVREQVRRNPAKLRQVGLRYDLAHAKAGVLDEDSTQKKKRGLERAKERAKAKDVPNNSTGYLEGVVQRIITTVQEELRRLAVSDSSQGQGDGKVRSESPSGREESPPEFTKSPPGCWPADSIIDNRNGSARETEDGLSMQARASKMEENSKNPVGLEKPGRTVAIEPVPLPVPAPMPMPMPPPPLIQYNDAPAEALTSSDYLSSGGSSESDSDSDGWSDSDSDGDISDVGRRWNPVCIMCLRVYAQDKEVSITLVEGEDSTKDEEEGPEKEDQPQVRVGVQAEP